VALPAWSAWIVHVPVVSNVTDVPDTVHTDGVVDEKVTASPDDAVALTVTGEAARVTFASAPKLIVWSVLVGRGPRISTAARFQRSLTGAVSEIVTLEPAGPAEPLSACIQNVSPAVVSIHWWTIVWPGDSVRPVALSQSLPAAYTSEFARVVVNVSAGAPFAPFAALLFPTPAAPRNATIVNDMSKLCVFCDAVKVAFVSCDDAVACHTSDVPSWVLDRLSSDHVRPPPDIVSDCGDDEPSDAASATINSPGEAVLRPGVVTVPRPSTDTV
jgi:hypothetical protein